MYRNAAELVRSAFAIAVVFAVLATGCGSDADSGGDDRSALSEEAPTADDAPAEPAAASGGAEDTNAAPDDSADTADREAVDQDPVEVIELGEDDRDGLEGWHLPAMGGITFGVGPDDVVIHDGDMVLIRAPFDADRGRLQPGMIVAFARTAGNRSPDVLTTEALTSSVISGTGTAEPSGRQLDWLDRTLDGWRFTLDDGLPPAPHYVVSAYGSGFDGVSAWQPFPHAELFLADTPNGVLVIGWIAETEQELEEARAIFDRVAPTISLANSPEVPIPPAELPDRPQPQEPPTTAPPLDRPDDWPSLLTGLSKPLDTGSYSTNNLETPVRFDLPGGWWVQPNFPGWVVLTGADSFGSGDRGIEMFSGLNNIWAVTRAGTTGEPMPAADLAGLPDAPFGALRVLETEEVQAGIASGVRMRVEVDPSADCTAEEPCEYWLTNVYPYPPASLRKGYIYDMWYFDEGIDEPVLALVSTPDAGWFETSDMVMDSLEFVPGA